MKGHTTPVTIKLKSFFGADGSDNTPHKRGIKTSDRCREKVVIVSFKRERNAVRACREIDKTGQVAIQRRVLDAPTEESRRAAIKSILDRKFP